MRGREFLMKDAYSFDLDYAGAVDSYRRMMLAYMRTFQRLGVKAIPMVADTGPIGGDLSHEFIILAPTGESGVFYDADFETMDWLHAEIDAGKSADLDAFYRRMTSLYAATDEKHDTAAWDAVPEQRRREGRGIEVGHIFYFGRKYSEPMGLTVAGPDGAPVIPEMGSYGIGVSRLAGAIIEASHDDAGIIWPDGVAPFAAAILNLKQGDPATDAICETLHAGLGADGLYDDRAERAGVKFARRRPDGPSMADRRGPARRRERQRGTEAPCHQRAHRTPCPETCWPACAADVRPLRACRGRALPARPPRGALRLRDRRVQPGGDRVGRRDPDHRHVRHGRVQDGPARPHPGLQRRIGDLRRGRAADGLRRRREAHPGRPRRGVGDPRRGRPGAADG